MGAHKPSTVTVVAILNIVFGALGLVCTPINLVTLLVRPTTGGNLALDLMRRSPYYEWSLFASVVGFFLAIALLVSGIGLLGMRPWARLLAIGWAGVNLAFGLVSLLLFAVLIAPQMVDLAQRADSAEATGGAWGGLMGGIMGGCAGLIYPIVVFCLMNTQTVKNAFLPDHLRQPEPGAVGVPPPPSPPGYGPPPTA